MLFTHFKSYVTTDDRGRGELWETCSMTNCSCHELKIRDWLNTDGGLQLSSQNVCAIYVFIHTLFRESQSMMFCIFDRPSYSLCCLNVRGLDDRKLMLKACPVLISLSSQYRQSNAYATEMILSNIDTCLYEISTMWQNRKPDPLSHSLPISSNLFIFNVAHNLFNY